MEVTTEQAVLNLFWPDDDTKTISYLLSEFTKIHGTEEEAKTHIKRHWPDVSDWSI